MSSYPDTIRYLFALQRVGIKLGLDNIRTLLEAVGNPHTRWPAIHLAGTNGKGSTAAMLEAILRQGGYRVGLYTSPHLVDFTERIRIDRQPVLQDVVIKFVDKLRPVIDAIQPSFFEVTTALAFRYFADCRVDIAIIETGMGGRLDSTNVLTPLATAITPIGMDHQEYLGDSLPVIAAEKAGIIKPEVPCLTNNHDAEVLEVLREHCRRQGARFVSLGETPHPPELLSADLEGSRFNLQYETERLEGLFLNLPGAHQLNNALLAVGVIRQLRNAFPLPEGAIAAGLQDVQWRGRLHRISRDPDIIIDVSHNPAGVAETMAFLGRFYRREQIRTIIFLQSDKDFRKIGELISKYAHAAWVVDLPAGKPLPPEKLQNAIEAAGGTASILPSFNAAWEVIAQSTEKDALWLIIGSHYLAGEAYRQLSDAVVSGPFS